MSTTGAPAQTGEQRPQRGDAPRALPGDAQRPLRADAQRNYQRLVTAASAAFAEHGADDASLEEIARRAGVGIGTLYRHFPNRQALLEAVYRDQVDVLSDRARQLSESQDPGAALDEWLRALVSFGRTKRSLTSAMLATLDKDSELMSTCSLIMRNAATTLLKRAQEAGVVRADANATDMLRLVHAVSMAVEREPTDQGQADRLLGLIMDGLRHQPPGPR
jgi:AcrR family transcriptional regulator